MIVQLFVLAFSFHFGQSEPTITYTCPGKNAKAVFEDLSKQAGQTLLIGQSLAEEPIILRLGKAPLSKTMERLAFALNGEWKEDKEGKRLVAKHVSIEKLAYEFRFQKILKMQEAARLRIAKARPFGKKDAEKLILDIEAHLEKIEALPEDDEGRYETDDSLFERLPATTFIARIGSLLDPKQLASIGIGERIVWSSYPTNRQRQLPSSAFNSAVRYLSEIRNWTSAIRKRTDLIERMVKSETMLEYMFLGRNGTEPYQSMSSNDFNKVNVIVANPYGGLLTIEVVYIGRAGNEVERISEALDGPIDNTSEPKIVQLLNPIDKPLVVGRSAIELSELYFSGIGRSQGDFGDSNRKMPSKFLLELILNPVTVDPLSIAAGPAMIKYSELMNVQLVAVLDDSATYSVRTNSDGMIDQTRFLRQFRNRRSGVRTEIKDGWLSVALDTEFWIEYGRSMPLVPRAPLGRLLQQCAFEKFLSIEAASKFLCDVVTTGNSNYRYVNWVLAAVFGIESELLNDSESQFALRVHASLSPMQLLELRNKGSLVFNSLNESQKQLFRYLLYIQDVGVRGLGDSNRFSGLEEKDAPIIEPTEVFVPDIDPNSVLQIYEDDDPEIVVSWTNAEGEPDYVGVPVSLASTVLMKLSEVEANITGFQVRSGKCLRVRLLLNKALCMELKATEHRERGKAVKNLDELPPEIAKRIRDDMAKSKPPNPFLWKQAS